MPDFSISFLGNSTFVQLGVSAIVIAIAIGLLAYVIYFFWRRHQELAIAKAKLESQIGKDAHDLDLDARLGLLQTLEIRDRNDELTISISYRQCGRGPDLLLLHGIGASNIIYRRLAPLLSADFRVTCIDFPGFGRSSKPRELHYDLDEQAAHLISAVEGLNIERPLVVASSMGGAIALAATVRKSDWCRGIVGIAPATDPTRIPTSLLPLGKHGEAIHRIHSEKLRAAIVRTIVGQVIARRELITPGLVALYFEPFRLSELASAAFFKAFGLLADRRMPGIFRNIKIPLLILRGLRDRLVKQSSCEMLREIVADSQLITHPTGGHHLMEDEPEFVAEHVRRFASELP